MRTILVTNSKGGCGKSTIATNLAAYYASEGYKTTIADFDPQATSLEWLAQRPDQLEPIAGIAAYESGFTHLPRSTEFLVIDAPARSHGHELAVLMRKAESILVPVLPSPIDIKAAAKFIGELLHTRKIEDKMARVGLIGNRVRENTLIFEELDDYLSHFRVPYLTHLREAQNYIRSYQRGIGIHELPEYLAWPDWEQWDPIIEWLESRRSLPRSS